MRAPLTPGRPAELLELGAIEDPHPFFSRVREASALSRVGETGVHMVATWESVLEVLGRETDFSANLTGVLVRDADGEPSVFDLPPVDGARVIATADEPRHGVHRRILKPGMSASRFAKLEPAIRGWAREIIADWLGSGGGDFAPISEILPCRVIGHLLGLPEDDLDQHRAWAMMGGEILAGDVSPSKLQGLAAATAPMAQYLGRHLAAAAQGAEPSPGDSLMSRLAAGVDSGEISASEATGIAIVMFGAGGESTTSLIGSAVRLLAENPELADQLRADPARVPRFVEEAVRLEPPFKFHYRAVRRECELEGYALVPGDRLMLLWAAANRDPAIFSAPDEIDLNRKHPKHHLSFGRGAHFCLGEQIARLETRVMIEEILASTGRISLDPDHPPVHARSIFVRRLEKLPIVIDS